MHRDRQRGMGLIEAMAALVIFSVGLLALAALYIRSAPEPAEDSVTMTIQAAASGAFTVLQADPSALPVSVTAATSGASMPTTALTQWFMAASSGIPGFTATIHSGPDAAGDACSPQSCGITLTLAWSQMGDTRSQEFYGQIGFH